jgi:hypothetical protein
MSSNQTLARQGVWALGFSAAAEPLLAQLEDAGVVDGCLENSQL